MALPPGTTDEAFLREVDEELRRDQLLTVWQRYGRWIVALVVIGLLAFAGYLYWQNRGDRMAGRQGVQYDKALENLRTDQTGKAQPELRKLGQSGNDGYRAMALIAEGNILLNNKDLKGAAAKYREVADDASLPQPYRDMALVRQTYAEMDTLKPEAVISRLKGLALPEAPWFGSAGEMVATAYLKQGKRAEAGELYGKLAQTEAVPQSIRQRAVQMAGVLGVDAIEQTEEKKSQ